MADDHASAILTVRELTAYVKRLFDRDELLQDVVVRGEVSNAKHHRSGHLYFTLKDEDSALDCVCFRNVARGLAFDLEDGIQVVAGGRVSVYEKQGRYQLIVLFLRPDGVGALHAAFERLRAKLQAEGLFEDSRKRPLPPFPTCIALVTSPTGAAIRDLTTIISRRFPLARMIVVPAVVQGEAAPASLIQALRAADSLPEVDVIILGRGGGSLEDLWAFNDEALARAIFASHKPVISAVGHETDLTISDLVADLRAPTPSAAAELAVPDATELLQHLSSLASRARSALRASLQAADARLSRLAARRPLRTPSSILEQWFLRTDEAADASLDAITLALERASHRLRLASTRLEAQRPEQVMQRRRERLLTADRRARLGLIRVLERARGHLWVAQAGLRAHHPRRLLARRVEQLASLAHNARSAVHRRLERGQWRLNSLAAKLDALNPSAVLERGYSITLLLPDESVVRSATQVEPADELRILLSEGELRVEATDTLPAQEPPADPGDADRDDR